MLPISRTGEKQHRQRDDVGDAHGESEGREEKKGSDWRKGGQEDEEQYSERTQPILAGNRCPRRPRFWQLIQFLPDRLEFGRRENGGNPFGQEAGNDASRFVGISGVTQSPQEGSVVTPLAKNGHEVHGAINDPPCQVAAKSTQQYGAHVFPASSCDIDGTGKSEHHDQAEQNLGESFDRFENAFARRHRLLDHDLDTRYGSITTLRIRKKVRAARRGYFNLLGTESERLSDKSDLTSNVVSSPQSDSFRIMFIAS
jgi:hypothetical protein